MQRFFIFILILTNLFTLESSAVIIETAHFKEIIDYVTDDTLVLLDIDDTLLVPAQTLGTDVWYYHRMEQHKSNGLNNYEAFVAALTDWEAIRKLTKVKIVEEGTAEIIQEMQKKNVRVIGLTTQGLVLALCTTRQLKSLNIDLSVTAPSKDQHFFLNKGEVFYHHGTLFTGGTAKGEALFKLLNLINYYPKRIVFINDKTTHVRDVEMTAEKNGIEFYGLRYSFSDERVSSFRKDIADIQWEKSSFNKILSDEEAEQFLP